MDPDATLQRIFDHLLSNDYDECENCFYACMDMHGWINRGGEPPEGHTVETINGFLSVVKKHVKKMSAA